MGKKVIYVGCSVYMLMVVALAQADLPEWEAAIDAANPVHWYKFDEVSGTDCMDSGSAGLF